MTEMNGAKMKLLFITDPLEKLDPGHDSTVAMMESAQKRGHEVWNCTIYDLGIGLQGADAVVQQLRFRPAKLSKGLWLVEKKWLSTDDEILCPLSDFSIISMRTDPPVNEAYLRATYILDHINSNQTIVVNSPSGLRNANEKLYALFHRELMPNSLVSGNKDRLTAFTKKHETAVAKPTGGMAGRGILLLKASDPNLSSIIDVLTDRGRIQLMVQKYISEVKSGGDRRIIVIDGKPIGAIKRLAKGADFRCNMATGAESQPDKIDETALRIVEAIGPTLRKDGLWFVGLDIIGDYLTEVNVTSPTGIREIQALSGIDVADVYIEFLEELYARK